MITKHYNGLGAPLPTSYCNISSPCGGVGGGMGSRHPSVYFRLLRIYGEEWFISFLNIEALS
jgi:hypothetical protein